MKTKICSLALGLVTTAAVAFTACNKDESSTSSTTSSSDSEIAIASKDSVGGTDSVYFKHDCAHGLQRDSIAQSALPAAVLTYLDENYSGYTFEKAFSVDDSTGTATGYLVIIDSGDQPVGLEFDAEGDFVGVLERREGRHGGHHHD